ncbi:serine hydrolase [Flammeovirga sp. SJP92]|uniref:serine hydrolase domain-containing protein n=1 Tax=Flammeovirga sp. SJP92 TaxID=1775430 RepID=UPI00156155EA|nr:serine hydrolase domain-containing protein [Flammeovirga sp. SJP92]
MKKYFLFFQLIPLFTFAQTDAIDQLLEDKINMESENPVHHILLSIKSPSFEYHKAFGTPSSGHIKESRFRIASSTKLFVSTIVLQLAEEKKLHLKDKTSQYLKDLQGVQFEELHIYQGKSYSNDITIEQLLSHRSGLADIFSDKEEAFFNLLLANPQKQYSPQSILALYYQLGLNKAPHFTPNKGWYYSDMNYVLLGLIIEQIQEATLANVIRKRILEPLSMKDTFFEFYEPAPQPYPSINQYVGTINFSEINTSFDWSGGGLVSTNKDLSIFIKALFNQELINKKSLKKMTNVKFTKENENRYGLGMDESTYNGNIYYGHYGFYGTYIGYSPKSKTVISYCISQATPSFSVYKMINEVLELLSE